MTVIIRQIEEMKQKEKAVQTGPCSTQLEGSVGNVREVGRETRNLKTRERKIPKNRSKEKEWEVVGRVAKLRRESAKSALTTATKASARHAAGRASASTTSEEAGASNVAGRASASTTT